METKGTELFTERGGSNVADLKLQQEMQHDTKLESFVCTKLFRAERRGSLNVSVCIQCTKSMSLCLTHIQPNLKHERQEGN